MKSQIVFLSLLAVLAAACASTAPAPSTLAPSSQLEKVTLNYGAPIPFIAFLPFDVAQALNLYKQEGLDVTVQYAPRIDANNALLGGSADFAGLGIDQPIAAQAAGKSLRMLMAFTRFPDTELLVRSDMKDKIQTLADLKGQQIAYAGAPGMLPYLVAKAGLKPGDVQYVHGGNVADIAGGMEKGQWVAANLADPYATQLLKSGKAFVLVDLRNEAIANYWLGGQYPNFGLVTTADFIQKRPETVQKMTNALVQALSYLSTHNAEEIAALLPEAVTGKDRALYVQALQRSLPAFSNEGLVTEGGVKDGIEINKALGVIKPDQPIDAGSLYTIDFVEKASPVKIVAVIDNRTLAPGGLAVDKQGSLYVADVDRGVIRKFDSSGNPLAQFAGEGFRDGQLECGGYCDLAIDATGNLYVADLGNNRVEEFDSNGRFVRQWGRAGSGDGEFSHSHGLAVDAQGNVYVMEHSRSEVQKFDNQGHFLFKWGGLGNGPGEFGYRGAPSIAISPQGEVYVPDDVNGRIEAFTEDGKFLRSWPGCNHSGEQSQHGIAVDRRGNVYVTDFDGNQICAFNSQGKLVARWGDTGKGNGEFSGPWAIAVDGQGDVYVSDEGSQRVQEFRLNNQ
jgi:ABC-type nitrate/sulfonate/bicarbonate transport system substrate-binding protein/streptogramin lyase